MTEVKISGISKSYSKGKTVLFPVELKVNAGELFFLLGPSGCGKSTLLRILAGLVEPDCGDIFFNGKNINKLPPEKRATAMVFQNYALWPHMTVFENVAFGLRAAKKSNSEIKKIVQETLDIVKLGDCADRKVPSLSGGQQQRVALARALAVDPAVLLLDEPLSNLDASLRESMRKEIRRICKAKSLTAIYVTHDQAEALSMADRIALMSNGVIEQADKPETIYNFPKNSFAANFLGEANIFSKDWISNNFKLNNWNNNLGMIRPENISFAGNNSNNSNDIVFKATLEERTFLGDHCEWRFNSNSTEFTVYEYSPLERNIGEEYTLEFNSKNLIGLDK